MKQILKFTFLIVSVFISKTSIGQLSKASIFYNTGNLFHDISQFKYSKYDFFGGINTGLEFSIDKKWNVGILYTNFYMHRLLTWQFKQERTYTLMTDDLFSLCINRKLQISKKLEWQIGIEPTFRFSFVSWADSWTQGGIETVVMLGGFNERNEMGFKLSTAIRYYPLKNERLTIDIYAKRSGFQITPNFSQFGLGFGYAFYKKKME